MTRIIGHMVTKNEFGRYLQDTLRWLRIVADEVMVYDDQSDDGTWEFLGRADVWSARRGNGVPSFLEHESKFRQAAWSRMEAVAQPSDQDWILCVDADEFLVAEQPEVELRALIEECMDHARANGRLAVNFPVHETFGFDGDAPLIRLDGFWGGIHACRLVRWRPDGRFEPCPEGGGSIPTAWRDWRFICRDLALLHLGYARPEDRQAKHARYEGGRGHNRTHVSSILRPGRLVPWQGMIPPLKRSIPT